MVEREGRIGVGCVERVDQRVGDRGRTERQHFEELVALRTIDTESQRRRHSHSLAVRPEQLVVNLSRVE